MGVVHIGAAVDVAAAAAASSPSILVFGEEENDPGPMAAVGCVNH